MDRNKLSQRKEKTFDKKGHKIKLMEEQLVIPRKQLRNYLMFILAMLPLKMIKKTILPYTNNSKFDHSMFYILFPKMNQ